MQDFLINEFRNYWNKAIGILPELITGIIVLTIFYFLARLISSQIKKRLSKRIEDKLLSAFLGNIAKVIVIFIGILFFMKIIGLTSFISGFIGGAAVSAIVIGFAFKDIIENFLAGIILAFNRPFQKGDTIVSGDISGDVIDLTIRYTHLKSFEGFDVYIPNAMMITKPLINYTRDGFRRFEFEVNIDYTSDMSKATEIISDVINSSKEILKKPAPMVIMDSFKPDYGVLKVFYWVNNELLNRSQFIVKSDVIERIASELIKGGINLPIKSIQIKDTGKPLNVNLIKENTDTNSKEDKHN